MSGNKLIDDYLSDLMDDADPAADAGTVRPAAPADAAATSPEADRCAGAAGSADAHLADADAAADETAPVDAAEAAAAEPSPNDGDGNGGPSHQATASVDDESPAAAPATAATAMPAPVDPPADPLAAFRAGGKDISEDEFDAMLDVLAGKAQPPAAAPSSAGEGAVGADPLASFRHGGNDIGEDEFDAMLDALAGKPVVTTEPSCAAGDSAADDPLAAFRSGGKEISEDEFEAMLDALQGAPSAPSSAPVVPPPGDAPAAPAVRSRGVPRPATRPAAPALPAGIADLLPPDGGVASSPLLPEPPRQRQRRADERISSWLRFNIGRQHFAVEVLKVQEVLRLSMIMPVRGTERAMLGVMNLRGQIVPILDLAVRLGFGAVEPTEASRIIVLEENGETLGLLVASVADVANISDAKIERISGTPSLVAADIVRGIARRDGNIIILLDASRLLA